MRDLPDDQGAGVREEAVVLEYEHQLADMEVAVRMLLRRRPGLIGLLYHPAFHVCVALGGAALIVLAADTAGMSYGVMLVAWGALMLLQPRASARQLLKANRHHGGIRTPVGADGVRTVSAHADAHAGWAQYGTYSESDGVFALRSPDRAGRCAIVLPKRGARAPEDVDRLREILDRNLTRV